MIQQNKSIIDNDVLMKGLINQGKEAGYITYEEIMRRLPENTTPEEAAPPEEGTGEETPADPCAGTGDPCEGATAEDPCGDRDRGGGEDEGGVGRGFILS